MKPTQIGYPEVSRLGLALRWFKRIFWLFLAAILVFLVYLVLRLGLNPFDLGSLKSDGARTNILILGVGDVGHEGSQLSDTNLVVSLDRQTNSTAMISVPRDLKVTIPGYYAAKINAANALGGSELAEQVMSDALNIPMHYYFQADFSALRLAVDAVGGLDIKVEERLYDPDYPCADNQYQACGLDIRPGNYHMDGATVLSYTRCRKGTCGNDFGRAKRQQEVLNILKNKMLSPGVLLNPWRLNALVTVWRQHISTNMTVSNVARMVWMMGRSQRKINLVLDESAGGYLKGVPGSTDLVPVGGDFTQMQAAVNDIFILPSQSE